jgi:NRAMP (natural resistance-associated macrophage protein)-like metal ion transporter
VREQPTRSQRKQSESPRKKGFWRSIGLGLITGAADDDPSAIGTYASAGAKFGFAFLWTVPFLFPMMFAVVYLASKLGQVAGEGLFAVVERHYPRWFLYIILTGVLVGNIFEAAADIGGMAAAINVLAPVPRPVTVVAVGAAVLALQVWGSYALIRNIFRWLALALLAYLASALLARPALLPTLKGTFIPTIQFNREFLSLLVAAIGCSLSAYIFTWQSNEEVEEQIEMGRTKVSERRGASDEDLKLTRRDVTFGMLFSSLIIYFIVLSTAATLFQSGKHDIQTAAEAAAALAPLAGRAAGILFAVGVVAVGFLAVPVMTAGAAYDLCQTFRWHHGLHAKPSEAKEFYIAIAVCTAIAVAINFLGINPMRALVWAGIVQGFSTPPLFLLIMRLTNNRRVMGDQVNSRALNVLGWLTTAAIFSASAGLVLSWIFGSE